nr:GDSL-type esterase/lipase family protein [Micromonospora sp. DSM 115978]
MYGILAAATAAALALAGTLLAIGPASAQSNGGVRVMPLGDSITDGLNVPGGYRIELWNKFVAGGYRIDFVGSQFNGPPSLGDRDHQGHSGWTIAQIDANVVNWLRATTPRTVLLHIGTNDMFSQSAGAPQRLSTLIDKITNTAPDAEVFVASIIRLNGADSQVRTYNAAIPGIVQSKVNAGKRVHFVDMYPALGTGDLADGVHPNAGGYAKMATVWYDALRAVPRSITDGSTPTTPPTTPPTGPPPTTPPTSAPPTTPPPAGACSATYRTVNSWPGGYQGDVTVRAGTNPINGWTVRWSAVPAITQVWGGILSGGSVRNASWNGSLAPNATTTFGFIANGSPATPALTCTSP